MLTRTDAISIYLMPHLFSSTGHIRLRAGKKVANYQKFRMTRADFDAMLSPNNEHPVKFVFSGKTYWLFQGGFYKDSEGLRTDDVKALLITRKRLQAQRINRAKTIAAMASTPLTIKGRAKIPDNVKLLVWERDGGRCARCGSQIDLQYDHNIPFSLGGSNEPDNLQILCGSCNRAKSNSIA